MINLVREHSHNNDISVYYDDVKKNYFKISLTDYGQGLLENEVIGIKFLLEYIKL